MNVRDQAAIPVGCRNRFAIWVPRGSVRFRVLHGVAWIVLGSVAQQGGSFAAAVLLARILGRHAYGQFALIQSSLVAMTTVASLALGVTATKYVSEYRISQPEKTGRVLGLASSVAAVAALVFSGVLFAGAAKWTPGAGAESSLLEGARIGALYVFFITMNGYQLGAIAGFEAFQSAGLISVAYGASNLLLSWSLATVAGLRGAVAAQVASACLLWTMYHFALHRQCRKHGIRIDYKGALQECGVLWRFSVPGAACGIVASLAIWWCNAYLVQTRGFAELAVFAAANTMRSMVLFVPAMVARVTSPLLNSLRSDGRLFTYRRTFLGAVVLNASVAIVAGTVLMLNWQIVLRLFGRDFRGSNLLLAALLGASVLEVIGNSLFQALFSSGRIWKNLAILSFWAAVLITASRFTVPAAGAAGLALAYLFAWGGTAAIYAQSAWVQNRTGEDHVVPQRIRS